MEKLDVSGAKQRRKERKGPVQFSVWATPWSRGEDGALAYVTWQRGSHTRSRAIKARLHGAEDAARLTPPPRASKRFVGEVIEPDRARPPSSTMFKPLLDEFCGDARHRPETIPARALRLDCSINASLDSMFKDRLLNTIAMIFFILGSFDITPSCRSLSRSFVSEFEFPFVVWTNNRNISNK